MHILIFLVSASWYASTVIYPDASLGWLIQLLRMLMRGCTKLFPDIVGKVFDLLVKILEKEMVLK